MRPAMEVHGKGLKPQSKAAMTVTLYEQADLLECELRSPTAHEFRSLA